MLTDSTTPPSTTTVVFFSPSRVIVARAPSTAHCTPVTAPTSFPPSTTLP
jgi:hypothetical protein